MVLIHLTDRDGNSVGTSIAVDVVPRIGERVTFRNTKGELIGATVCMISHQLQFEQDNKMFAHQSSDARVYILLDIDADQL